MTGEAHGSVLTAAPEATREHVLGAYRKRAKRYDLTSNLYYGIGFRVHAYRRMTVDALQLRPGATVVDVGCGTGLNFSLIQDRIGPRGRLVAVDLTEAMLAEAGRRVESHGWSNVSLVQSPAHEFDFPSGVDAVISSWALTLVPECAEVIARGSRALAPGGRLGVLDTKPPVWAPDWVARVWLESLRPFGVNDHRVVTQRCEAMRASMEQELTGVTWRELYLGFAFSAAGTRRA